MRSVSASTSIRTIPVSYGYGSQITQHTQNRFVKENSKWYETSDDSAHDKAAIDLRLLVDKSRASDLCDEFGLQPTQIYAWQKQPTTNATFAFQSPRKSIKQTTPKTKSSSHWKRRLNKDLGWERRYGNANEHNDE